MSTRTSDSITAGAGGALGVAAVGALIWAVQAGEWDAAGAILAGLLAAVVVVWQGGLIKRQIAFSTFVELDKEWNEHGMLECRRNSSPADGDWDDSSLEGALEFFEKVAGFWRAGVLDFDLIYSSTIGWYAVRYWLFTREEIVRLRNHVYDDPELYCDLEALCEEYARREAGKSSATRDAWESRLKKTEASFWTGERKG